MHVVTDTSVEDLPPLAVKSIFHLILYAVVVLRPEALAEESLEDVHPSGTVLLHHFG